MSPQIFWATLASFNCFLAGINLVNNHLELMACSLFVAGLSLISVKISA